MTARVCLYALVLIAVIFPGISAMKDISEGYSKDIAALLDFEKVSKLTYDPKASSFEIFVRLTPNGSKAIVTEVSFKLLCKS